MIYGGSQPLPGSGSGLTGMTCEEARVGRMVMRCSVFWMDPELLGGIYIRPA